MTYTHYDTLKVAHDAPLEVIRAAYRVLSQKYHPDRNSNDPSAAQKMAALNAAYEALCDPARRREHDFEIAEHEAESELDDFAPGPRGGIIFPRVAPEPVQRRRLRTFALPRHLKYFGVVYLIAVIALGVAAITPPMHRPRVESWVVVPQPPQDREAIVRKFAAKLREQRALERIEAQKSAELAAAPIEPHEDLRIEPTPKKPEKTAAAKPAARKIPVHAESDEFVPTAAAPSSFANEVMQPIVRGAPAENIDSPGEPLPVATAPSAQQPADEPVGQVDEQKSE